MDRYTLICRLRWPAYILLTGVIAMLAEWTDIGWGKSWPLYIMLEGVLQLAQRWALSSSAPPPVDPNSYPGPYTGSYAGAYPNPYPAGTAPQPVAPVTSPATTTAIVPTSEASAPQSTDWRS
jgi:hypothetical protein